MNKLLHIEKEHTGNSTINHIITKNDHKKGLPNHKLIIPMNHSQNYCKIYFIKDESKKINMNSYYLKKLLNKVMYINHRLQASGTSLQR